MSTSKAALTCTLRYRFKWYRSGIFVSIMSDLLFIALVLDKSIWSISSNMRWRSLQLFALHFIQRNGLRVIIPNSVAIGGS